MTTFREGDRVRRKRGSRAIGTIEQIRLEHPDTRIIPVNHEMTTPAPSGFYYRAEVCWEMAIRCNRKGGVLRRWIHLDRLELLEEDS